MNGIKWAVILNILLATADSIFTIFCVTGNLCIFCVWGVELPVLLAVQMTGRESHFLLNHYSHITIRLMQLH